MAGPSNPLLSSKSSDSGLHVLLHPLVLLNISDHITRHVARQQTGPVVGALIGEQKGRSISLEHVFDCRLIDGPNGETLIHQAWFEDRLKQFKDVHKSPALDLMGWFTITPSSGPTQAQLPIHKQILQDHNETAVLLSFHASELENSSAATGKLPITIFESTYEEENVDDGGKAMEIDGQQQPSLTLKFRELPYSIETGEAEMIAVDSVARGGGNATAIQAKTPAATQPSQSKIEDRKKSFFSRKDKGKDKAVEEDQEKAAEAEVSPLSKEDEDLIANLTTRLNAVKTLDSRLRLIKAYLSEISTTSRSDPSSPQPQLSHTLLRNIYALISHLSLLNPQNPETFAAESIAETNDVALVALLSSLGQSVQVMREIGKKYAVVDMARQSMETRKAQMAMRSGMTDDDVPLRRSARIWDD